MSFTNVPIIETEEDGAVTYADLAQILQNRIIAGLRAGGVASDSPQTTAEARPRGLCRRARESRCRGRSPERTVAPGSRCSS